MQTPRIPPMALLVMPCGLQSARERSKRSGLKWVRRARSGPGVGAWPNNQRLARDCGFESTSVQSVFLLYLRASKPRAPAPRAAHIHMPHLSRFGRAHPPFTPSAKPGPQDRTRTARVPTTHTAERRHGHIGHTRLQITHTTRVTRGPRERGQGRSGAVCGAHQHSSDFTSCILGLCASPQSSVCHDRAYT